VLPPLAVRTEAGHSNDCSWSPTEERICGGIKSFNHSSTGIELIRKGVIFVKNHEHLMQRRATFDLGINIYTKITPKDDFQDTGDPHIGGQTVTGSKEN